jgi:hypothetical protein
VQFTNTNDENNQKKEKQNEKGNICCDNDDAYCIPEFWTNGWKNVAG